MNAMYAYKNLLYKIQTVYFSNTDRSLIITQLLITANILLRNHICTFKENENDDFFSNEPLGE